MWIREALPPRRGDVFWITPEKSIGSEQDSEADRPGIIISNNIENRMKNHVLAVFTTTQKKPDMPTHTKVTLPKHKSITLCEQIRMVKKEHIHNYITACTHSDIMKINRAIGFSLNIGCAGREEIQSIADSMSRYCRGMLCTVIDRQDQKKTYRGIILSNNIGNVESTILEIAPFKEGRPILPTHVGFRSLPGLYLDLCAIDTVSKARVRVYSRAIHWENLQKTAKAMEISLGLASSTDIARAYQEAEKLQKKRRRS